MIRLLNAADTTEAQILLRARPLENVFLDHVISAGVLGRVPGFFGCESAGRLEGILMVGPLGGTTLEVRDPVAFAPLAAAAAQAQVRPRHIVGNEVVTAPFWAAYEKYAAPLRWSRREPVYCLRRVQATEDELPRIGPASESDLDEIVRNSASQHREDLQDDRWALDPGGFAERHRKDIRDGRWWVTREAGRISFQVHVGAENRSTVQLGGVMTPAELRSRGHATRGMQAICQLLLQRRPAVSLFCDESNLVARRVYERVGFELHSYYRSWLLDEPLCSSRDAAYL